MQKGVQGNEAAQARVFAHDAIIIVEGAINWSADNGGIKITSGGSGGANPYVVGDEITLTVGSGTNRAVFVVDEIDANGLVTRVSQKYTPATLAYSSGAAYTIGYSATQHATTSTAGTGFTADVVDLNLPNTKQRGACIYVGNTQTTLVVVMESGRQVTFKNAQQGNFLPIQVIRVVSWNTGLAGDVLALY